MRKNNNFFNTANHSGSIQQQHGQNSSLILKSDESSCSSDESSHDSPVKYLTNVNNVSPLLQFKNENISLINSANNNCNNSYNNTNINDCTKLDIANLATMASVAGQMGLAAAAANSAFLCNDNPIYLAANYKVATANLSPSNAAVAAVAAHLISTQGQSILNQSVNTNPTLNNNSNNSMNLSNNNLSNSHQNGNSSSSTNSSNGQNQRSEVITEESSRKREMRLLKNREAARECRRKKKEYIKCLENRVAVLENQNKTLIEELRSLKELYCQTEVSQNH